jgi:hypothetical protein
MSPQLFNYNFEFHVTLHANTFFLFYRFIVTSQSFYTVKYLNTKEAYRHNTVLVRVRREMTGRSQTLLW